MNDEPPTRLPSLDLYAGLDVPQPPAGPAGAPDARRTSSGESWLDELHASFPLAIRDRYRLRAPLGEGAMGVVIEALDTQLGRLVAIKGARDPRHLTPERRARLVREARLHARLTHPNILPVYDAWTDLAGNPWCSMMRVEGAAGSTLAGRLAQVEEVRDVGARPLGELLQCFLQICRGVAHAHHAGILHRDLKPDNILLGPSGEALVADWGLAASETEAPDAPGEVVGTPGYAAPDQFGAGGAPRSGPRTEVFSHGVIRREIVVGPAGRDLATPMPARVSGELGRIILRATRREEPERFASVDDLRVAVEAHLSGGVIEGMHYSPIERLRKWVRARPRTSTGAGLVAGFVMVLALVYARNAEEVRHRYEEAQRNLAVSHVARAVEQQRAGQEDAARLHAALAFQAAARVPGYAPPEGPVQRLFAVRPPREPLAWACRLDAPVVDLFFGKRGNELSALTTAPAVVTWPLADTRAWRRRSLAGGPVWNGVCGLDGALVATGTLTGDVRLHRPDDGGAPLRLGAAEDRLAGLALSPDGALVVTGLRSRIACLWSTRSGQFVRQLTGHRSEIWAMRFTPDGTALATCGRDGEICLWNLRSGASTWRIENPGGAALALAFSPDGRRMVSATGTGRLQFFDVASGAATASAGRELGYITALAWSPDGRWIASGGQDFTVRIWAAGEDAERARLAGHPHWVTRLAFSADGARLASASGEGTVCLWDVARAVEPAAPPASAVRHVAFRADGRALAIARDDGTVVVRDTSTGQDIDRYSTHVEIRALAFPREGAPVIAACPGAAARPVLPVRSPSGAACTGAIALDLEGRRLAWTDGETVRVSLDGSTTPLALQAGPARTVVFSADGTRLATAGKLHPIRVWDTATGGLLITLPAPAAEISSLAFSADGRQLVSGAEDATVRVHDLSGGSPRVVGRQFTFIGSVVLSPAGDVVVSASAAGMRAWQLPSARSLALFAADGPVRALAFSRDGALLACGEGAAAPLFDMRAFSSPAAHIEDLVASSLLTVSTADGSLLPKPPGEAPRAR